MPAITSPVNKAVVLRGATAAAFPKLMGTVMYEQEQQVRLAVPDGTPVNIGVRVIRSNGSGLLDFEYRLSMPERDYDDGIRLVVTFGGRRFAITFADFRADLPGALPPNGFASDPQEHAVFRFDYGLSVSRPGRACFISTNAREFDKTGGKVSLFTGQRSVSVDTPAPSAIAVSSYMQPSMAEETSAPATGEADPAPGT